MAERSELLSQVLSRRANAINAHAVQLARELTIAVRQVKETFPAELLDKVVGLDDWDSLSAIGTSALTTADRLKANIIVAISATGEKQKNAFKLAKGYFAELQLDAVRVTNVTWQLVPSLRGKEVDYPGIDVTMLNHAIQTSATQLMNDRIWLEATQDRLDAAEAGTSKNRVKRHRLRKKYALESHNLTTHYTDRMVLQKLGLLPLAAEATKEELADALDVFLNIALAEAETAIAEPENQGIAQVGIGLWASRLRHLFGG